jgi:hypothetical protein
MKLKQEHMKPLEIAWRASMLSLSLVNPWLLIMGFACKFLIIHIYHLVPPGGWIFIEYSPAASALLIAYFFPELLIPYFILKLVTVLVRAALEHFKVWPWVDRGSRGVRE